MTILNPAGHGAMSKELRGLLLAGDDFPTEGWVRDRELLPALITYLRIGRAFRRNGLGSAVELIPAVTTRRSARSAGDESAVFCARSAAWRITGLARTLAGRHLCLHESLALCGALRGLGFSVQVVVGYPVIESADGAEELHAWPALGTSPVSGRGSSRPLNYVELIRYPQERAPWS